ncbi:hypothetical protein AOR01nite_05270 [Acetobacter orleanensis]|uniref:Uncharacterized protein n=1 Tax=Acetobacter orleanensis TaxID=104099 RepID=A0A4Y3TM62_9PROT|nr:hypothetical protein AOR01nite_05270 [Acetobacter orleanensis]
MREEALAQRHVLLPAVALFPQWPGIVVLVLVAHMPAFFAVNWRSAQLLVETVFKNTPILEVINVSGV